MINKFGEESVLIMNQNLKKNILITGVSGYLGLALARQFLNNPAVGVIVGTDINKPSISAPNFIFEKVDIRNKEAHIEILKKYNIAEVFHLAFILGEIKDEKLAESVNIGGTRAIFEAVNSVPGVRRVIIAGSVSAYGAFKENKTYLTENEPLRADTLKYGINKRLMEEEINRLRPSLRVDLGIVVLRICTIVGPTERGGGAVSTFLGMPVGLSIIGHDAPVQFVHEEDLFDVFNRVLEREDFSGTYNVAPHEYTTVKSLSKRLEKPIIRIPFWLLYAVFWLIHKIKPSLGISENSAVYLAYPIIVDSGKIERELGVKFNYSSLDSFMDCVRALKQPGAKKKFKILLVNLQEGNFKQGLFGAIAQPPICHAFLAGMIPDDLDIDVQIIDEQIEPIDFDAPCDAVALSVTTHVARKAYDYAAEFRRHGRKVVLGGYHITLMPDEAEPYADAIAVGEAEDTWPEIVRDLVAGQLKKRYVSNGPVDLRLTPVPRRELLRMGKYVVPNTVIATRGCPYMCSYCAASKIFGKYRRRENYKVIAEIKSLKTRGWNGPVMFVDDELFYPKAEALAFFAELEKLNIRWLSQATMTALLDREIMAAAHKAGCRAIMVGFESFNPCAYEEIKKFQNARKGIDEAIEYANSLGIGVGALAILGLDSDTESSAEETIKILRQSRFGIVDFSVIRAYPKTSIYKYLAEQNRVKESWWLLPDGAPHLDAMNDTVPAYLRVYYTPKNFTPRELQLKVLRCEAAANSPFCWNRFKSHYRFFTHGDKLIALRVFLASLFMYGHAKLMLRKIKRAK